jgi:formate transporter
VGRLVGGRADASAGGGEGRRRGRPEGGLVFAGRQYEFGDGAVGASALASAQAKGDLGLVRALALGASATRWSAWPSGSATPRARVADKVLAIVFHISAFVALGFEHSVANMCFLPMGVLIREYAPAAFWQQTGASAADFPAVTWTDALVHNLLPVTAGNLAVDR